MPPLPSLEALAHVNAALAGEQGRADDPARHLQVLLGSLDSESLSVRCGMDGAKWGGRRNALAVGWALLSWAVRACVT